MTLLTLGRKEVNSRVAQTGSAEPTHQALAEELFFLGLYDEAVPEFAAARSEGSDKTGTNCYRGAATPKETHCGG